MLIISVGVHILWIVIFFYNATTEKKLKLDWCVAAMYAAFGMMECIARYAR